MAKELAVAPSRTRNGIGRAAPRVTHSGREDRAERFLSRDRLRLGPLLTVSESRRAGNRERVRLRSELRCECARPNCTETVPGVAETHRGNHRRFVVSPAHVEGSVVVRAADRFFVVEPAGYAFTRSQNG